MEESFLVIQQENRKNTRREIEDFLKKMENEEKTLRWTHLGTGWFDIPIRFHKKIFRSKYIDFKKIAQREYDLYKNQNKYVLKSELAIYSGILSGRPSMIGQSFSILTLLFSITAILLSLGFGQQIIVVSVSGLIFLGLFLFFLFSIGADRLTWREMHIRVIVLSYLLFNLSNFMKQE